MAWAYAVSPKALHPTQTESALQYIAIRGIIGGMKANRTNMLNIRLTNRERHKINLAAAKCERNASDWARTILMREAQGKLAEAGK